MVYSLSSFYIATRSSRLAIRQAESVRMSLLKFNPKLSIYLLPIKTQGDVLSDVDNWKSFDTKGLFVKQLEVAIGEGKALCAVHSLKDVPYVLPNNLSLAWIGHRSDPSDAFVSDDYNSLDDVPYGGKIGTSSIRRSVQLLRYRPDLNVIPIRGNILTRLSKIRDLSLDGVVLASAGLVRLGLVKYIKQRLPFSISIPAPGQGFLAIESKKEHENLDFWSYLDVGQQDAVLAHTERRLGCLLGANCNIPFAANASYEESEIRLRARLFSPDGLYMAEFDAKESTNKWQALAERAFQYFKQELCRIGM
ncbi:hydroxymethylbilane synthase [Candidatus Ichthyocystis sparus]|nr:hydroxymethylbilane synthase [Candidatus Ichthyocystis sparus]